MDALNTASIALVWLIPIMVATHVFLRFQTMATDLHRIADAVEKIAQSETHRSGRAGV